MSRLVIVLAAACLLSPFLIAKDKKKQVLPDYVLQARTIAVIADPNEQMSMTNPNDLRDAEDNVEKALTKWGRFTPTVDPRQADLVIMIRKGRPAGGTVGGMNPGNRPVIMQPGQTTPGGSVSRGGVVWGQTPTETSQPQQTPGGPAPGAEVGPTRDLFELYRGQTLYPLDGPVIWRYMGKDALSEPDVRAVEAFKKVVTESDAAKN